LQILATGAGAGGLAGLGFYRWRTFGQPAVVSRAMPLLGTLVTITVHHPEMKEAENAIKNAFEAIRHVDQVMSIHRSDSDITRVNQLAGREMVSVDASLCEVVEVARRAHEKTEKAYDVTGLPVLRRFGFYSEENLSKKFPTDREIQKILDCVGQQYLKVDSASHQIGFVKEGCAMDLGSVGKGYAVDRAGSALKENGIESGLVDIGGNILAIGVPLVGEGEGRGWSVAIRNPEGDAKNPYLEMLSLKNEAVATSGNYENYRSFEGRTIGHLFDMRTGHPSNPGMSSTVVASNATLADALSTSSFLLGPKARASLGDMAREIYFHEFL